jgi:hypothetical protein
MDRKKFADYYYSALGGSLAWVHVGTGSSAVRSLPFSRFHTYVPATDGSVPYEEKMCILTEATKPHGSNMAANIYHMSRGKNVYTATC